MPLKQVFSSIRLYSYKQPPHDGFIAHPKTDFLKLLKSIVSAPGAGGQAVPEHLHPAWRVNCFVSRGMGHPEFYITPKIPRET